MLCRGLTSVRAHLLLMRLDWREAGGLLCAPAATTQTLLFSLRRVDQLLQELSCYLLTQLFSSAPLTEVIDLAPILHTPVARYPACAERSLRDCGVVSFLRDTLSSLDEYVANHT